MFGLPLFALGYLVRDGQPSFKDMLAGLVGTKFEWIYHLSTQLARATGALICGLACLSPWLGLAVLVSYYSDMKHGEGQGAATWQDAMWLTLSGVTSMAPISALLAYLYNPWCALTILGGLLKAPIWFAWGHSPIQKVGPWFQPTRFSAMTFGLVTGVLIEVSKWMN